MMRIRPIPEGMTKNDPYFLTATWFGVGRIAPASGTLGTLAAIPFGYLIALIAGPVGLAVAALLLLVWGTKAADRYGTKSGVKDDQAIVVDEVVGLWIAAIPAETNLWLWALAFLLFRFFDVWKPWPASYFDRKEDDKPVTGFSVMMDDVVAGIMALFGVSIGALSSLLN